MAPATSRWVRGTKSRPGVGGVWLALQDLHAGRVAECFIHAQAAREADIIGDLRVELQPQTVGEERVRVVAVRRYERRGHQHSKELLLHRRGKRGHSFLQ